MLFQRLTHLSSKACLPASARQLSWCRRHWAFRRVALSCSARCLVCRRRSGWLFLCRSEYVSCFLVCPDCFFGIGSRGTICCGGTGGAGRRHTRPFNHWVIRVHGLLT